MDYELVRNSETLLNHPLTWLTLGLFPSQDQLQVWLIKIEFAVDR